MTHIIDFKKELRRYKNPEKAKLSQRFFKTGKGEYAQGDIFLGLTVPQMRLIAKKYPDLSLAEIKKLIISKLHEERQAVLFILVDKFQKSDEKLKKEIFNLYCKFARYVNNWDLVDCSADKIVGAYLWQNPDPKFLFSLAESSNLWERRISIIATGYFIKKNSFENTLKIAEVLLKDKHDLIHKAVGWMLREIGKRNLKTEESFLKKYYKKMPRVMLRYAIEKFSAKKRKKYLKGVIY